MKNHKKGFVMPLVIIIVLTVIGGGAYIYYSKNNDFQSNTDVISKSDSLISSSPLKTYSSEIIGITFEYPSGLGIFSEKTYEGGSCDLKPLTSTNNCEHRYIIYGAQEYGLISAESREFGLRGAERSRHYNDTDGNTNVDDYCVNSTKETGLGPVSCVKSVNKYGMKIVNLIYKQTYSSDGELIPKPLSVNYIETKSNVFPIVVVYGDKDPNSDMYKAINIVIQSIRPIK